MKKYLFIATIALLAICIVGRTVFVHHGEERAPLTSEAMIAAAKSGGDYLIRIQQQDGRFIYRYDARENKPSGTTYSLVRHRRNGLIAIVNCTKPRATRPTKKPRSARSRTSSPACTPYPKVLQFTC